MTKIAFIGLGIMGSPMAGHLVKGGYDVVGVNRGDAALEKLVSEGGSRADSVADAVKDADVIITMVPDSPDVQGIALGEDGIYANAPKGSVHIDMSSIRPDVAAELAAAGKDAGIRVIDAPVSGGEAGAVEAVLSIMVGGEQADFDEVQADPGDRGQDHRARRAGRRRPDGEGRQPAHRGRQLRADRRGDRLPPGLRRRPRGGARGAGRWTGGQHRHGPQGRQHAGRQLQARLPDRPAPQGHGHHRRCGPGQGRRDPAGRRHRTTDRLAARPRRRRTRPLRVVAGSRATVRSSQCPAKGVVPDATA